MANPFKKHAGIVLGLVLLWKFVLLLVMAQPIPFSDSFFYDGAVVNWLNWGHYCNPSLELVLPIAGTKVFSAYPPLYQLVLCGWMSVFGTSALAAMWLHFVLFGLYGWAVLAIFRQLKTAPLWVNFSCVFLFGITLHDRPDSLAFALGFWAAYAWLRALEDGATTVRRRWYWSATALNILTLATSVQLGILFWGLAVLMALATSVRRRTPFPWMGLVTAALIPAVLGFYVKVGHPELWAGFQEHVRETPLLLGLRASNRGALVVAHVFKLGRFAPGVFLAALCLGFLFGQRRLTLRQSLASQANIVLTIALLASAGLVIATTVFLIMVAHWILYFQVLIVALTMMVLEQAGVSTEKRRWTCGAFLALALIVGSRAVGMSTWGVANWRDVNYTAAMNHVRVALEPCPTNSTVVASAGFLYEANRVPKLRTLHADWLNSYRQPQNPVVALLKLKPQKLILTQFDWHRTFKFFVTQLAQERGWVEVRVVDHARIQPPDASPMLQRLLQHTSWAPVIVELQWQPGAPDPGQLPAR